MGVFLDLAGPLARLVEDDRERSGPAFFRPYRSASDAATGVASIITAPFLFPAGSIACFVIAGYELLNTIWNTLTGDFSNAKKSLKESAKCFGLFLITALLAPCSPLINLIDVIGSIVNTARGQQANTFAQ